jgi:hypothetical protein
MRINFDHRELWPHLGGLQRYPTIAFAMAGMAAVAVAWKFQINTNLFYVVYLACSYGIVQLLTTRLFLRLGLFALFLFFLFYSPKQIPAIPEESKLAGPQFIGRIVHAGATRSYRFKLAPLRDRKGECGSQQHADIYVHFKIGDWAEPAPVLSIDHGTISGQDQTPFYAGYTILRGRAEFAGELPGEVVVGVHNPGQKPFEIYLGPEVAKGRIYPEAVFIKFETPECLIVAHSSHVD